MKIGIDCRLWNETGIGRYIRNLVDNLQEIDNKNNYCLFVLNRDKDEIKSEIRNSKFEIRTTDIKWHTLDEQLSFSKILNREDLSLMHFPYFSVPIFYNCPFVVTIHDLIVDHFSTGQASTLFFPIYVLKFLAYKFVLGQAARKATKIIAVSRATKQEVVDHLKINPQKISVVYEGIGDEILDPKSQIRNPDLKNQKYFLYVGNAYPHKNLDRLLKAFKILNSNVNLVLVAKEDYFYQRLREKVGYMNLSKKVIFKQNVSDEELSSLYQNALALIMPSLMEGFGLPALEAMANNCLVLASDIPSLNEVCDDCAIYFDPYSIEDIVKKMNEICSGNMHYYSDKKEKGLNRAKLFSWKKMAKETLKIYESGTSL